MDQILALVMLGFIVQFGVEALKKWLPAQAGQAKWTLLAVLVLSLLLGVYYTLQTGSSLLLALGFSVQWLWLDILVTGLLIGAAGSAWHELLALLRKIREDWGTTNASGLTLIGGAPLGQPGTTTPAAAAAATAKTDSAAGG